MEKTCAVVLALNNPTEMKSKYPQALSEVLFKPLVNWLVDSCTKAEINDICVVLGDGGEDIKSVLDESCITIIQEENKGIAHAITMVEDFLNKHLDCDVIVLSTELPFVFDDVIKGSCLKQKNNNSDITVISDNIVIENHTSIQKSEFVPCWLNIRFLLSIISEIKSSEKQEYPLDDIIKTAINNKKIVSIYKPNNPITHLKASNKADLLKLNTIAAKIVIDRLLLDGVNFYCIDGIVISPDAKIGRDTTIAPGTIIKANVVIGEDCNIGPNTVVADSIIGNNCEIDSSLIESSKVGNGVHIGPNSHLRPNCIIDDNVKIGNFVEIKNSTVGKKSSIAHLTYVGDTDMGSNVNMGGGCITVNYNGYHKYRTIIGDNAFIGCNTNLIAPVTVQNGAFTAAGSTIYINVESDALAIARAHQVNKPDWTLKHKKRNQD